MMKNGSGNLFEKAMNKARIVNLQSCLAIWLVTLFSWPATATPDQKSQEDRSTPVVFFDVSDLPARIDEPKLYRNDVGFVLKCAMANRSSEQLLGLRLILLIIEPSGKLRSRITWTEASELATYSIKTFELHPTIKGDLHSTDQLFLAIDEVIGHETIWRAEGADKALRAYSRGQHDVMPTVRTVANKFDPRTNALLLRRIY
jgi:hypothetical protein